MQVSCLYTISMLSAAILACAPAVPGGRHADSSTRSREPPITDDGLVNVGSEDPGVLFLKPGHMIGSYDDFYLDEVAITYKNPQSQLDLETEERLIGQLRGALVTGIVDSGFQTSDERGPCVLRIGLGIHNLQLADLRRTTGASTAFIDSLGSMTLVTEFRDSQTGEALLRYATRHNISGGVDPGSKGFRWRKLSETFDEMMADLSLTLANNNSVFVDTRLRPECQGKVRERGEEIRAATDAARLR